MMYALFVNDMMRLKKIDDIMIKLYYFIAEV